MKKLLILCIIAGIWCAGCQSGPGADSSNFDNSKPVPAEDGGGSATAQPADNGTVSPFGDKK
ncbi:MAG: hypothetical protein J0L72_05390 [Armatimonadetes bacterium]|nr:hypothetical protein [Armatimonadota bacterium]